MKKVVCLLLWYTSLVYSGFVADTLVKTPQGYTKIKDIHVGDNVYGVSKDGGITVTDVTHVISYQHNRYMIVGIEDEQLIVARGQKFFLPYKHIWRKAKKLHEHDQVLSALYEAMTVESLQTYKDPVTFYEIRLRKDHAFLVTQSDIVVHNCPLFSIGVLVTWGCGKVAVEAVWASVCLFGMWLGTKLCGNKPKLFVEPVTKGCNYPAQALCNNDVQDQYSDVIKTTNNDANVLYFSEPKRGCNYAPSQHEIGQSCGAARCVPPRDGPNGCHIPSSKHIDKQRGNASPGLGIEEGQKALDVSVPVKDKDVRVAVWDGKYIVFRLTDKNKNIWHNYIVSWNELRRCMKNTFKAAGLVKENGKIIKKKT